MTADTEGYLADLARKSFLKLWSYPAIYRDQGNAKGGDGKEIVDLMVVFGNDVVLFSDKSCEYPSLSDAELAWKRWYRRAIEDSADQLYGASRWIKSYP